MFQLAVEEHPDYVYGYYHLGRAYEAAGRDAAALSAYKKAVTKDTNGRPGMEAAFRIRYKKGNK